MRHDLCDKIVLCVLCIRNILCYDVLTMIIKTLMIMELIKHYVTHEPIYLQYWSCTYLKYNYEDFKLFINDHHQLMNTLLFD